MHFRTILNPCWEQYQNLRSNSEISNIKYIRRSDEQLQINHTRKPQIDQQKFHLNKNHLG